MRSRGDPQAQSVHTLSGAYAMDAVSYAERVRFERHLAGCDACRQEVRGLREATAALGSAAAVRPPDALRETVLHAARQTRQVPPAAPAAGAGSAEMALVLGELRALFQGAEHKVGELLGRLAGLTPTSKG